MSRVRMKNLGIGKRLVILVCFALAVNAATAVVGMTNNRRLAEEIHLSHQAITRPLAAVGNARGQFNEMRTALYDLAQEFNSKEQNKVFKDYVMQCLDEYERNIQLYRTILEEYGTQDPYEAEAVDYLHSQLAPLRAQVEFIVSVAEKTGYSADAVRMLRGDFLFAAEDISADLSVLTEILEAQTRNANLRADALNRENNAISAAIIVISAVILLLAAYFIVNSIIRPLSEMTRAAESLSGGALDVAMEYQSANQLGVLADSLRFLALNMKEKLAAEQQARESEIARVSANAAREAVVSSITYASKIQHNLLPPESEFAAAFADYHCIWKPKDIVGGDIYWIKNFNGGTVLCACDCTGHGTPGALLTMLVVSTFEAVVNEENHRDTADIIWELEKRLVSVLNVDGAGGGERGLTINDGCDLAVLYIGRDGEVTLSAANTCVYVCDGKRATRMKGQRIRIGDGALKGKSDVRTVTVPPHPGNAFYVASDGLYEQVGGEERIPFGYDEFERIILKHHGKSQKDISGHIWQAFEAYRGGGARRDDFQLIAFRPRME